MTESFVLPLLQIWQSSHQSLSPHKVQPTPGQHSFPQLVFSTNCWSYPRNVRMVGRYSNRPLMESTDNIFFLQQFIRELQSIPRRWFTSCRNLKLPKLWTPQLSFSLCCNRSPCLTTWTISNCLAWSTAPLWLRSQRDEREPVGASSFTSLLLRLEKTNSQENDRRHHYTGRCTTNI